LRVEHHPNFDSTLLKRNLFKIDDGGASVVWLRSDMTKEGVLAEKLMMWEQPRLRGRSKNVRLLINHSLKFDGTHLKKGAGFYFKKCFGSFPRHTWASLEARNSDRGLFMTLSSPDHREMKLSRKQHGELLTLAETGVDVFLASFEEVRLRQGQQLQAGMDFNSRGWKLTRGELVRFDRLEEDGAIRLSDGRVLSGSVVPLQPAVAVRELAPSARGCDRVVVFAGPDDALLEQLRHVKRKVVFVVDSPEAVQSASKTIAEWVEKRLLAKRTPVAKPKKGFQAPEVWGHNLFGNRAIWRQLLGLQTEVKKVIDVRSPAWIQLLEMQRAFIRGLAKTRNRGREAQRGGLKPPLAQTSEVTME